MTSLDELEALLEKATAGEWRVHGPSADPHSGVPGNWQHHYEIRVDDGGKDSWPYRIAATPIAVAQSARDFALIAALRNAAPSLIAAAREGERMREALGQIAKQELSADMSVDDQLGGDFEGAYDHMIELARAALSAHRSRHERSG